MPGRRGAIGERIAAAAAGGRCALVPYVMAGFPDAAATVEVARGLVRGGADVIELGMPFSDPLADGPAIQGAAAASLAGGMDRRSFMDAARAIRAETDVPLVLMTYANVLHSRGYGRFVREAAGAGIDGIILPDLPAEEAGEYLRAASGTVDTIFLASPNTGSERFEGVVRASSGFLYMVAVIGTTGVRGGVEGYTVEAIRRAKGRAAGRIPVGAGFGVSGPGDVARYARAGADAVIVGSAYVGVIAGAPRDRLESRVASFTRRLAAGTVLGRGG